MSIHFINLQRNPCLVLSGAFKCGRIVRHFFREVCTSASSRIRIATKHENILQWNISTISPSQDQPTQVTHSCGRVFRSWWALAAESLSAMHFLWKKLIPHHTSRCQVIVRWMSGSQKYAQWLNCVDWSWFCSWDVKYLIDESTGQAFDCFFQNLCLMHKI